MNAESLYHICVQKEKEAALKASIFGLIHTCLNIFVLVSGMVVLTLSPSSYPWKDTALLIIGGIISTIKTLTITIDFQHKAIVFEQISIKMRRLVRTLISENPEQVGKTMDQLYKEFDDLDLSLFSESILGGAINRSINSNERDLHINSNERDLHMNSNDIYKNKEYIPILQEPDPQIQIS